MFLFCKGFEISKMFKCQSNHLLYLSLWLEDSIGINRSTGLELFQTRRINRSQQRGILVPAANGVHYGRKQREPYGRLPCRTWRQYRNGQAGHQMVARCPQSGHSASAWCPDQSDGRGFRLSGGGQQAGFRGGQGGCRGGIDRQSGLVARRLGALWRSDDPFGLALGRVVPGTGRARWRWPRQHPFRAVELLAGQCQPRQGATVAVAGQEEIRQRAELGGPDPAVRYGRL